MGAPIVYRWDDDNAPVLAGVNTRLIALLKACLVDGYGTKAAAGWTMPYDDGQTAPTKAVFRNNPAAGTGFYLRVDNTVAVNYAGLQGYESMTDVDTGVLPIFTGSGGYQGVSSSLDATARPWVLVADDRYFVLLAWTNVAVTGFADSTFRAGANWCCFGDGISLHGTDNYFCVLMCNSQMNPNYPYALGYTLSSGITNAYQHVARNVAGDTGVTQMQVTYNGGPYASGATWGVDTGMARISGQELFSRPYVNDSTIYSIRGYLPGLWHPCHDDADFVNLEEIPIGTHVFLVLVHSRAMVAIDISENWRP